VSNIPSLAHHFVAKHGPRIRRELIGFTPAAMDALCRYAWPGNVRVEQALVFCEGDQIRPEDLPSFLQGPARAPARSDLVVPDGPIDLNQVLEDLERQLILRAYEKAKKVKTETARLLGIKTSALYYKLEKYGLIPRGSGDQGEPIP
jgi:two-component system response regulator HydG